MSAGRLERVGEGGASKHYHKNPTGSVAAHCWGLGAEPPAQTLPKDGGGGGIWLPRIDKVSGGNSLAQGGAPASHRPHTDALGPVLDCGVICKSAPGSWWKDSRRLSPGGDPA
jgi:hypothetical protein